MNPLYSRVAQRAGNRCEYCRAPEPIFNIRFEVEHIAPQSLGGDDSTQNLALACRSCNQFKSIQTMGIDPETEVEVRLFHPREDHWHEHFHFDRESTNLVGTSPVGRATIIILQLNSEFQLASRKLWLRLGLYP